MNYLMIENRGAAPVEAFTVFGATTTRYQNIPGLIGQFGSGANMGTITLLRHEINPVIYCGKTRLEFFTAPLPVKDVGGSTQDHEQVCIKFGGTSTKTEKLSWTTAYGEGDWKHIALSLREYVSNAIDAMLKQGVPLTEVWESVNFTITDEMRARDGFTRVYIPIHDDWRGEKVTEFHDNIAQWFLHVDEPHNLDVEVMEKGGRNLTKKIGGDNLPIQRAVIYRRGVFVREFERDTVRSLFDYNIKTLPMNESRTVDDQRVLEAAGQAIKRAKPEIIARVLRALKNGENVWEGKIGSYSLTLDGDDDKEALKLNWETALKIVGGENAVVVTNDTAGEIVGRKGYVPVKLPYAFADAARSFGLVTEEQIITDDDRKGRTYSDANPALTGTLDRVWDAVVEFKMTNGREKPGATLFHEHMNAGNEKFGFYRDNTVFVHQDYATAENDALDLTVLEEVAHHCSGATDMSRDFQQWLMRFILASGSLKAK